MATHRGVGQAILQIHDESIYGSAVSPWAPPHADGKVSPAAGEATSTAGPTALQLSCTHGAQPHPWCTNGSRARCQESWWHHTLPAQLTGRGPLREGDNGNVLSNVTASNLGALGAALGAPSFGDSSFGSKGSIHTGKQNSTRPHPFLEEIWKVFI